ncbi:MAG: tRNA pseudouridine(38-40) synthase TruA [Planctomycetota bacterium]|jgi:tRNA pseudouridine38-40 synthase
MGVRTLKLTISYDGADYSGWQHQPGKRTIQGELERAFGDLTGSFQKINGASRTDAGVSAMGQVANVTINSPIPTKNLAKAVNDRLPRDIIVSEVVEADGTFDASTSAGSKLYRYTIFIGRRRNVLKSRNCWHYPRPLDVPAMDAGAKMLLGTHDFRSFAAASDERENSVRTVVRCDVAQENQWIYVDIEADRFLHKMVRNIVGTLVEIGRGRWKPERMQAILEVKKRTAAGPTAPGEGLCLVRIHY